MNTIESHNEWDPLEEVIVGRIPNDICICEPDPLLIACLAPGEPEKVLKSYVPSLLGRAFIKCIAGSLGYYKNGFFFGPLSFYNKFSSELSDHLNQAQEQLENFVKVLTNLGIVVKRPDPIKSKQTLKTPYFQSKFQVAPTCPRDTLLVVGNTIIEAPMATRGRYFEQYSYRNLLVDYFKQGCNWVSAPKGMMSDDLYRTNYPPVNTHERETITEQKNYITKDHEVIFEAADVLRCGKDLFVQHGFTTNRLGIQWLKQFFGDKYRVHSFHFKDESPIHIDATLCILRPGLVLVNPDRPLEQIDIFKKAKWKIVEVPKGAYYGKKFGSHSSWLCMNMLIIDPHTIIVEASETSLIRLLESLQFRVIALPFTKVYPFGGSFHCFTADIRRKGTLEDYFSRG